MVLLARFAPLGVREPEFVVKAPVKRGELSSLGLALRGIVGGLAAFAFSAFASVVLAALKLARDEPSAGFDLSLAAARLLAPEGVADWIQWVGLVAFGVIGGLFAAAVFAARYAGNRLEELEPGVAPDGAD